MNRLTITTKTEVTTDVKVGEVPIDEVLHSAKDLAHEVLEELSEFKQVNNIDHEFDIESKACRFLNLIGD